MNPYSIAGSCMQIFIFIAFSTNLYAQGGVKPLRLDLFHGIPKQVDSGCNGLYTYDSVSLKKEEYIIVTNLQGSAYIIVNRVQIRLKLIGDPSTDIGNKLITKTYMAVFQGVNYQVILKTTTDKNDDETWGSTETWRDMGTLVIIRGKQRVIIKIHGISGC